MLENIEGWLDKAEQHSVAKKSDVSVLITARLAPDMKPFIYQVQSACDYVKAAAAWLSGETPPRHDDNEQTIEVRARIRKTVDYADSITEAQYGKGAEREITVSWAPTGKVLGGENYLLQMTIPNVFFHVTMAYAVLRHNGVEVGKGDFLGPIRWINP
jgi:hypothetical protein